MNLIVHSYYQIPSWRHPLRPIDVRLEGDGEGDHEASFPTDHDQPSRETTRRGNGLAFAKPNKKWLPKTSQQKVSFCQPPNTQQSADRWGRFSAGPIQEDSSIKSTLAQTSHVWSKEIQIHWKEKPLWTSAPDRRKGTTITRCIIVSCPAIPWLTRVLLNSIENQQSFFLNGAHGLLKLQAESFPAIEVVLLASRTTFLIVGSIWFAFLKVSVHHAGLSLWRNYWASMASLLIPPPFLKNRKWDLALTTTKQSNLTSDWPSKSFLLSKEKPWFDTSISLQLFNKNL